MDELRKELQKQFSNPKQLSKELIRRGWLTPFQVNILFQGKGKELVLGSYVLIDRLGAGVNAGTPANELANYFPVAFKNAPGDVLQMLHY